MTEENCIKFACPNCGQHIEADSDMVGMDLDCPVCGHPFRVPRNWEMSREECNSYEKCEQNRLPDLNDEPETVHSAHPTITIVRKRKHFFDRCKSKVKTVGIGIAVLLLFVSVGVLTSNEVNKAGPHTTTSDKYGEATRDTVMSDEVQELTTDTAVSDESLITRLRRMKFDVKVEDGGILSVSDTGVDEPVFITEERDGASSRGGRIAVIKAFGPWFVRNGEIIYKIKQRDGWDAIWGDSRYAFIYATRIGSAVSDKKLTVAIRDAKKQTPPIDVDEKYQTRWSILAALRCLSERNFDNRPSDKWVQAMATSLKSCPDDFQKAVLDLFAAIPRQDEDMVTAGGNLGALLGSMNEDNPRGGAIVGGLLGAIVGAAKQEEAAKEQARVFSAKYENVLKTARRYGADPKGDLSDAPFGWDNRRN